MSQTSKKNQEKWQTGDKKTQTSEKKSQKLTN